MHKCFRRIGDKDNRQAEEHVAEYLPHLVQSPSELLFKSLESLKVSVALEGAVFVHKVGAVVLVLALVLRSPELGHSSVLLPRVREFVH